jgi:hypothetical protein
LVEKPVTGVREYVNAVAETLTAPQSRRNVLCGRIV